MATPEDMHTPVDLVLAADRAPVFTEMEVADLAFSPDGEQLFVLLRPYATDVWRLAATLWPELLGLLVLGFAMGLLIVALRRGLPSEIRGVPYCRRCRYDLGGGSASMIVPPECPECGTSTAKRPPRRGRARWRRIAAPMGLALLVVCTYAAVYAVRPSRDGWIAEQLRIPSTVLYRAAREHGWDGLGWLFETRTLRVVAVDPDTGQIERTLYRSGSPALADLHVSPDGSTLVLRDGADAVVALWSETGSVRARLRFDQPDDVVNHGVAQVIGFSPDGTGVYLVHADEQEWSESVVEWSLPDGGTRVVLSRPVDERIEGSRVVASPSFGMLLDGESGQRLALFPGERARLFDRETAARTFTLDGEEIGSTPLPKRSRWGSVARRPGGSQVFFVDGAVRGLDLESGTPLGVLAARGRADAFSGELAIDAHGRLFFASMYARSLLVRDMHARAWVARLQLPNEPVRRLNHAEYRAPLRVSGDGRWLAVNLEPVPAGFGQPRTGQIAIFDLTRLGKRTPAQDD